jgi:hypothetical protein
VSSYTRNAFNGTHTVAMPRKTTKRPRAESTADGGSSSSRQTKAPRGGSSSSSYQPSPSSNAAYALPSSTPSARSSQSAAYSHPTPSSASLLARPSQSYAPDASQRLGWQAQSQEDREWEVIDLTQDDDGPARELYGKLGEFFVYGFGVGWN